MTVNQLHRILTQMMAQGKARCPVSVYKTTFSDPREGDGCVILPVEGCKLKAVLRIDDDGGTKTDSRGRECYQETAVIFGGLANSDGDIPLPLPVDDAKEGR